MGETVTIPIKRVKKRLTDITIYKAAWYLEMLPKENPRIILFISNLFSGEKIPKLFYFLIRSFSAQNI